MENKYCISAFGEIEEIASGFDATRDLKAVGNLFDTEEEALRALVYLKKAMGEYLKENGHKRN